MQTKIRCAWVNDDPLYQDYHDNEWGVPVHDDQKLYEFLVLEGAQAGLNWLTILKKRANYQQAFAQFDPHKVARFTAARIEKLMQNAGIVRNRRKIESAVNNARAVLKLQQEYGSLDNYLWQFVDGHPIINRWRNLSEVPTTSPQSDAMAKDLKQRGFNFVGSTICYAFMQAVGMVNDHTIDCYKFNKKG